jgi:threonine synthase
MPKIKLKVNFQKKQDRPGIWAYSDYLSFLPDQYKLSLGEGQTSEIEIEENLLVKREDENPTGSLKDRGMAFLVSRAYFEGERNLVLSSSGNAAISAAQYCQKAGINLEVFISERISPGKLEKIRSLGAETHSSLRPVSEAVKYARKKGYFNLRPSGNRFGPEGYQTIAYEILENQGKIEDIFIPVSSGTALVGVVRGFEKMGLLPRIHLCQGAAVHPLAVIFDPNFIKEETSLASALVAKLTPLKSEILKVVKDSGGSGWIISNQEILAAQEKLSGWGINTSAEGALALASYYKAKSSGFNIGKTVVLLTGKKY